MSNNPLNVLYGAYNRTDVFTLFTFNDFSEIENCHMFTHVFTLEQRLRESQFCHQISGNVQRGFLV